MRRYNDYISRKNEDVRKFAGNLLTYSLKHFERWAIPSPRGYLEALFEAYIQALGKFYDPNHGKVDTKNKNETKYALIKAVRTYVQGFIAKNPLVTDEDRHLMGLPVRDSTLTKHPAPMEKPETEANPKGRGSHEVTAINPETSSKKKPRLASGVVFASRMRTPSEPPSPAEDMPSVNQTGATRVFHYSEQDYGKIVDYATAYENSRGMRGPWSNVKSLIISG